MNAHFSSRVWVASMAARVPAGMLAASSTDLNRALTSEASTSTLFFPVDAAEANSGPEVSASASCSASGFPPWRRSMRSMAPLAWVREPCSRQRTPGGSEPERRKWQRARLMLEGIRRESLPTPA